MNTLRRLFNPTILEIISEVYMLVAFVLLLWYVAITLQGNESQPNDYIEPSYTGESQYVRS